MQLFGRPGITEMASYRLKYLQLPDRNVHDPPFFSLEFRIRPAASFNSILSVLAYL